MGNMEKRIERLENRHPKHRTVKDMTDDELAAIITGNLDAKASDLTDEYLQAIERGGKPVLP